MSARSALRTETSANAAPNESKDLLSVVGVGESPIYIRQNTEQQPCYRSIQPDGPTVWWCAGLDPGNQLNSWFWLTAVNSSRSLRAGCYTFSHRVGEIIGLKQVVLYTSICSCSSSFGLRSAVQHAAATAVDMSVMYRLQRRMLVYRTTCLKLLNTDLNASCWRYRQQVGE